MIGTATVALPRMPGMDAARPLHSRPDGPAARAPAEPQPTLDLLARARDGDRLAFEDLFARYETRVRRWAHDPIPGLTPALRRQPGVR